MLITFCFDVNFWISDLFCLFYFYFIIIIFTFAFAVVLKSFNTLIID